MTRFNETVGSYERSVLTAARRFDDLGIAAQPVPTPEPVEATVRTLCQPEPDAGTDAVVLDGEDRFEAGRRYDEGRDGTRG
jgi:DNA recombination protein RmuC